MLEKDFLRVELLENIYFPVKGPAVQAAAATADKIQCFSSTICDRGSRISFWIINL